MTLFFVLEHYTSLWNNINKKSGSEPDSFDLIISKRNTTEEGDGNIFRPLLWSNYQNDPNKSECSK